MKKVISVFLSVFILFIGTSNVYAKEINLQKGATGAIVTKELVSQEARYAQIMEYYYLTPSQAKKFAKGLKFNKAKQIIVDLNDIVELPYKINEVITVMTSAKQAQLDEMVKQIKKGAEKGPITFTVTKPLNSEFVSNNFSDVKKWNGKTIDVSEEKIIKVKSIKYFK